MLYQTALVGSVFFCVLALGSLDDLTVGPADLAMMVLLGVLIDARAFPLHRGLPRGPRLAARAGQLPAPRLGRRPRLAGFRPPARWLEPCGHGAGLRLGRRGGGAGLRREAPPRADQAVEFELVEEAAELGRVHVDDVPVLGIGAALHVGDVFEKAATRSACSRSYSAAKLR